MTEPVLYEREKIIRDRRLGGISDWPIWKRAEGNFMRVPDDVRKCVAFLMWRNGDKEGFLGTVFFVGIPFPNLPGKSVVYAVTAAHVIREAENCYHRKTADGYVYFRLNTHTSTVLWKNKIADWTLHPDDLDVDIAVSVAGFKRINMDILAYPVDQILTEDRLKKDNIRIGEDVFIAGLFSPHAGVGRNIPIVRIGNIAAMPEEPVNAESGQMEAYLVETRSIGGLSGSPVFIHLGVFRKIDGEIMIAANDEGAFTLLGIMHGHWDLAVPDIFPVAPQDPDMKVKVNSGIGIVTPAKKLLEVLYQPELVEKRKEYEKQLRWRMENTPVMDASVQDAQQEQERPFTKQDFEDALKKTSSPKSDKETT